MNPFKTIIRVATGRAGALLFAVCMMASQPCQAASARILFIGNSYTYVNDLPGMLSAIAKSLGTQVSAEMQAPGGYGWKEHARDRATAGKISEKDWTFVVLQEQSQRPDWPDRQLKQEVIPYALQLDKLVHEAHANTKTVFYQTWGHKNGDKPNCAHLPETCTYDGMQGLLNATYARIAEETNGILVPVGTAWSRTRSSHPEIELYSPDGIHPSPQGTYLAACVFYSALFRKGVLGADRLGLPSAEAQALQIIAQNAVFHPDN